MSAGRDRLAWAADLPLPDALKLYPRIAPAVGFVKVGLSLFVAHGPKAVEGFRNAGARVFLDLKLHDIPNTVRLAAEEAAALGIDFLTVHASGGRAMVRAAVDGCVRGAARASCNPPRVLAVTVLTSMADGELASLGWPGSAADAVSKWAGEARAGGATGAVCSVAEAARVRQALGPGAFICTPGIRLAGAATQDQARVDTPQAARAAGADLIVVGRPIHDSPDPLAVAQAISADLA